MRTLWIDVTMVARSLSSSSKRITTDTTWRTVTLEHFITLSDAIDGGFRLSVAGIVLFNEF
jgi:hypothetical protein